MVAKGVSDLQPRLWTFVPHRPQRALQIEQSMPSRWARDFGHQRLSKSTAVIYAEDDGEVPSIRGARNGGTCQLNTRPSRRTVQRPIDTELRWVYRRRCRESHDRHFGNLLGNGVKGTAQRGKHHAVRHQPQASSVEHFPLRFAEDRAHRNKDGRSNPSRRGREVDAQQARQDRVCGVRAWASTLRPRESGSLAECHPRRRHDQILRLPIDAEQRKPRSTVRRPRRSFDFNKTVRRRRHASLVRSQSAIQSAVAWSLSDGLL